MKKLIFAIDFDGTIVEDKYPEIGPVKAEVVKKIKKLQNEGHEFILWTCREGKDLASALEVLDKIGLKFVEINANPQYRIDMFNGSDCRKVGADFYVDDRALSILDFITFDSAISENVTKKLLEELKAKAKRDDFYIMEDLGYPEKNHGKSIEKRYDKVLKYIESLEKQLKEERYKNKKLEKELLKKCNTQKVKSDIK